MNLPALVHSPAARWLATGAGLAVGGYAAYVALTWSRYGRVISPSPAGSDALLDRFMPAYEAVERHRRIQVAAPAHVTLGAAREAELLHHPLVRSIIRARELALGASGDAAVRPRGLLAEAQALGWGVLAEVPGRQVVVGAVTRPWEANVTFRAVPANDFEGFAEPDYVKIAWTLRADPVDDDHSIFMTETRVASTDPTARAKFRRYWSFLSPGIILIRWLSLGPVKRAAEARWHGEATSAGGRNPVTRVLR